MLGYPKLCSQTLQHKNISCPRILTGLAGETKAEMFCIKAIAYMEDKMKETKEAVCQVQVLLGYTSMQQELEKNVQGKDLSLIFLQYPSVRKQVTMIRTAKIATEMLVISKVEKRNVKVKMETRTVKEPPRLTSDRVYLAAASHLKSVVLTAMRMTTLTNKKVLLVHMDYILGGPVTDMIEHIIEIRGKIKLNISKSSSS